MASAAAVATDASKSPLPYQEVDEELNTVGGITDGPEGIRSPGSASEEEEDDVTRGARRRTQINGTAPSNPQDEDQQMADTADEVENDLFGSGAEDQDRSKQQQRQLDDDELDSGDDEDRVDDNAAEYSAQEGQDPEEFQQGMDVDLGRHPVPEPSDGELYLMKIPSFFSFDPHQFTPQTWKPPVTDHHSRGPPSSTFSAYKTALSTIRWRRSPSNPSQLQSNARIVRWSDGSLTLQFASSPATHFPIPGNALAPPQPHPVKPTPVSKLGKKRQQSYNPEQDSFTYLATPHEMATVLRITNKFTAALKVQSATDASLEALERLQDSLAAASRARNDMDGGGSGIKMLRITEDPELAKKKAELAEKEKMKAQKRREAQEMRDRERHGRAFGRRGVGAGLTVGGLEDDDENMHRLPDIGRSNRPGPKRKGSIIYSDEEEEMYGKRGKTREDEYDEEDDFVAPNDEELEVGSDEDIDEGIIEPARRQRPAPRQETPKRPLDAEGDAEGDLDEDSTAMRPAGSPTARNKRRRVIEDDDDE